MVDTLKLGAIHKRRAQMRGADTGERAAERVMTLAGSHSTEGWVPDFMLVCGLVWHWDQYQVRLGMGVQSVVRV